MDSAVTGLLASRIIYHWRVYDATNPIQECVASEVRHGEHHFELGQAPDRGCHGDRFP
jgi:hypothetical protein